MSLPVAILAGGLGRRLGGPKAGVEVGGVPLLERVRRAAAPVADEVVVIAKAGDAGLPADLRRIDESFPERCPLAGLVASLEAFPDRPVLVLACDHPFLSTDLLAHLAVDADRFDARVPVVRDRWQPLVATYGPGAFEPFRRRLAEGHYSLVGALAGRNVDLVAEGALREFDPGLRSFLNVNDPSTLAIAKDGVDEKN